MLDNLNRIALVAVLLCGCDASTQERLDAEPHAEDGGVDAGHVLCATHRCDGVCYTNEAGREECRQGCTEVEDCLPLGPYRYCGGGVCWVETPPQNLVESCLVDPPIPPCPRS